MEEKRVRNAKTRHFLGKTRKWYRYQRVVPVPTMQRRSGIDTTQSGTDTHWQCGTGRLVPVPVKVVPVPLVPITLFLHIFAPLSPVFVHRLFRDPN